MIHDAWLLEDPQDCDKQRLLIDKILDQYSWGKSQLSSLDVAYLKFSGIQNSNSIVLQYEITC